ncbi:branched-chain-amino-acid aminotransferase, cytosolic [Pelodytes ibericus]
MGQVAGDEYWKPCMPTSSKARQCNCCKNGAGCNEGEHVPDSFKASDVIINLSGSTAEKPDPEKLVFGTTFTDHMLTIEWSAEKGWDKPVIKPFQNFSMHPAASVFHYAVQLFEGLKAYRGEDGKVRLFRPKLNMDRMLRSAIRMCLPKFDTNELLQCILKLVDVDKDWVPNSTSASLYIRPSFIGTENSLGVKRSSSALLYVILSPVGAYFAKGSFSPVSLWAEPKYVRAWKGGTGNCKTGGNYGTTIYAQYEAMDVGCQQVLWLYGEDQQITEVGTMNIFLFWMSEDGEEELLTPPLDGIILPGVVRQSILDLARKWGEFKVSERHVTMKDLVKAINEGRVKEIFGSGTACVVCPVGNILYKNENLHIPTMENGPKIATRVLKELSDIQYGRVESDWTFCDPKKRGTVDLVCSVGAVTRSVGAVSRSVELSRTLWELSHALLELSSTLLELSHALSELSHALLELSSTLLELSHTLSELSHALLELSSTLLELSHALSKLSCALSKLTRALSKLSHALSKLSHALSKLSRAFCDVSEFRKMTL